MTVSVAVGRDPRGNVQELRWLLWPPADADQSAVAAVPVMPAPEPMTDPPGLDALAATLHEVAGAAAQLVRADGAGLMLADQAGALRWVTATGEAEQAFERAQRDLDEGPCIDAFARNEVVRSTDLRADPRWPRLGPAVATNRIRGVLSVPVGLGADILGTCNAITHSPRGWTDADAAAIVAFGAVTGRLLRATTEARRKGDLAVQLQTALDSRIGRAGQGRPDGARGPVRPGGVRAPAPAGPLPVDADRRPGPAAHRRPAGRAAPTARPLSQSCRWVSPRGRGARPGRRRSGAAGRSSARGR